MWFRRWKGSRVWNLVLLSQSEHFDGFLDLSTSTTLVGFRPSYMKCWSNNLFSTVLSSFDLVITLRRPYQDLGITPYETHDRPMDGTMCTWLEFRPSYMTHSYTTLRVKGTILRWPLVTLSMHRKSADHLKVTWYIVRLKKYGLQKYPGGVRVSTFSPWSIYKLPSFSTERTEKQNVDVYHNRVFGYARHSVWFKSTLDIALWVKSKMITKN